jgi:hypothetical protein
VKKSGLNERIHFLIDSIVDLIIFVSYSNSARKNEYLKEKRKVFGNRFAGGMPNQFSPYKNYKLKLHDECQKSKAFPH